MSQFRIFHSRENHVLVALLVKVLFIFTCASHPTRHLFVCVLSVSHLLIQQKNIRALDSYILIFRLSNRDMCFNYFFFLFLNFPGQQSLPMPPRPSSNHSQTSNQAPINNSNQSNQPQTIDPAVTPPARPPNAPTTPTPTGMAAQGSYQTPPPQPPHMHGYKMGPSPGPPGPGPQNMPPYPPQSQQQYAQGNFELVFFCFAPITSFV